MKTMKFNFRYIALAIVGLTLLPSCEGDLDVEPTDAYTELDFLNNPNNAVGLVNGVYSKQLAL